MQKISIDDTFNGLATTREFPVEDVLARLIEIRDQAIEGLKRNTGRFEKGLTQSDEGSGNVTHLHGSVPMAISKGISSIAFSLARLELRQAAVDALVKLPSEVKTLELDFTNDLAEEVVRAFHKQAKERGKESEVTYVVPSQVREKLAL